ncbi:MAG: TIGR01620 family protein [Hyphomicrobiales bacterium]|nr:MAG: TIGR01620 family protein [Hyphomicrobiales bacterium]
MSQTQTTKTKTKTRKPSATLLSETKIVVPSELVAETDAFEAPLRAPRKKRKKITLGRVLWISFTGLLALGLGLWVDTLIADLFIRTPWLGYVGLAMIVLFIGTLLLLAFREFGALSRMDRIDALQRRAAKAHSQNDLNQARHVIRDTLALYAGRPETARMRADMQSALDDVMDGSDLIALTERDLLGDLDKQASVMIMRAAKRTSLVTAISPRALIDVSYVIWENLRLIRRLSQLYGGRPGWLSSWRLTKSVMEHLVLTGGMSATDNLIQDALGHGLAAKVSARLGEGVINGMLTARVGRAAMAVCRPLPHLATKPPSLKSIFSELTRSHAD